MPEDVKIVESKTPGSTNASFIYENAWSFHIADPRSLAAVSDQCIEYGKQHPSPGRQYKALNQRRIVWQCLESAYEYTATSFLPIMERVKKNGEH